MKKIKHFLLVFYFTSLAIPLFCQLPDFSKVPVLHEGDSVNITDLVNNGIKIAGKKAICWFPKDSLSEKQMQKIVDTLDIGIAAAEKFIGAPLPWQVHPFNDPITFYFRRDRFVSHASLYGYVSIPFWRIRDGKAPWLHEVMHEMLYSRNGSWSSNVISEKEWSEKMPLWLSEGLPDLIAYKVSASVKLPCFDVFSGTYLKNVDSLFARELKSGKGSYILSFIGSRGVMRELFGEERMQYAPAFYHGSHSFVKYLFDNYGLGILLTAISSFRQEHEVIEKLTGKSMEILKKEWLAAVVK